MTNKQFNSIWFFFPILSICILFFLSPSTAQPNLEWVKTSSGKSDNTGNAVAVDKDGNVYVAGSISGNVDFDPGAGIHPFMAPAPNSMCVSKYNAAGNLIWVKSIKAKAVFSIYVDDSCNVYTAGIFNETVDFDPDSGVFTLTNNAIVSVFICKWDSSSAFVWANKVDNGLSGGSFFSDYASNLVVDNFGNAYVSGTISQCFFVAKYGNPGNLIYLYQFGSGITSDFGWYPLSFDHAGNLVMAGRFKTNIIDIDPTAGTYNLDAVNGRFFILKLTPLGFFKWAKNFGSTSSVNSKNDCIAVATDTSDHIYLTGCFSDSADFDPSAATYTITGTSNKTPFIARYDSTGNFEWAKALDPTINNSNLALDDQANILLTGTFSGTSDFDPDSGVVNLTSTTNEVVFISKYSNTGILKWAKKSGGIKSNKIVSNNSSNIFIAGSFVSIADFDPSAAVYNLETPATSTSMFISKLDSSGSLLWANGTQGNNLTFKNQDVDDNGNLIIIGLFEGSADFNPDSTTLFLPNNGEKDIYVQKLNSSGNLEWVIDIGGHSSEEVLFVKTDNFGNIFICGVINDTVDFDPGTAVYKLGVPANEDYSSFIAKYDASGNLVWAKLFNENKFNWNNRLISDMDVDGNGNIFLTGRFRGTVDFDLGPGVHYLTTSSSSSSDEDAYIMKLNNAGNFEWAYSFGISGEYEYGLSVSADAFGNAFFSGAYGYTTIDFDPGPGVFDMTASMESTYVLKFNSSGNFVWGKQIMAYPGPDYSSIFGAELKASKNGDLFITGGFYGDGAIDFDPNAGIDTSSTTFTSTQDAYTLKWTEAGNFVWKKIQAASGYSDNVSAIALTELNTGNIYETFADASNFPNIKLIELNNSGNLISNLQFSGENFQGYVESDQYDNIYISGGFETTTDFDLSAGTYSITPSTSSDIFMSKYTTNNPACSIGPSAIISNAVNNTVCDGQPIALTQFGGVLSTGANFEWFVDSCGGAIAATGNSVTFYPNDTTTYFVRAVDSCGITTCNSITINVITSPLPPIVSGNGLFCTGDSIALDAGPGYQTYLWSTGSQTQTTYATGSGNYIVTISNSNGCTQSTSIQVTTHPNPPVTITPATKVFICLGDTVPFTVTNDPGYTYQWLRNSTPLAGEINSYYDAFSTGFYSCLVTDANSCDSITPAVRVKIICMPPMDDQSKIGIGNSENPPTGFFVFYEFSNSSVHIQAQSLKGSNYHLHLTDIAGKIIYETTGKTNVPDLEKTIECASFANGLYIITLRTEKELLTGKFVKE